MFQWTPDRIRFRMDAAEYTHLEEHLAEHLLPYLPDTGRICDAGCGLGHLSLILAEHGYDVTAADVSREALQVLQTMLEDSRSADTNDALHLSILQGDLFSMTPEEKYDAMIFSFFGQTAETLRAVRAQCSGKAILIKKTWTRPRFNTQGHKISRLSFQEVCRDLDALGIPYQTELFFAETGQPFRSRSDAVHFFRIYEPGRPSAEPLTFRQLPKLEKTGSRKYPYLLSSCKKIGMVILDAADIPDQF